MGKFALGLALASMFSLASGGKTGGSRMKTYKVRVTNLTFKQDFSPPIIVVHEKVGGEGLKAMNLFFVWLVAIPDQLTSPGSGPLFSEGARARNAISMMAEEGVNKNIEAIATKEVGFCGFAVAKGPLFPGKTWNGEIQFDASKCKDPVYSVVAKLDNTNDAFMGVSGSKFPKKDGCPSKHFPPAFDSGSEENNERCNCMPGRACPKSTRNRAELHGRHAEGFIHVHRGFQGVGDLSKEDYGWQNPVAEVVVSNA